MTYQLKYAIRYMYSDSTMESQVETFSAEMINGGRVTVPDWLRRKYELKEGSLITFRVTATENPAETKEG